MNLPDKKKGPGFRAFLRRLDTFGREVRQLPYARVTQKAADAFDERHSKSATQSTAMPARANAHAPIIAGQTCCNAALTHDIPAIAITEIAAFAPARTGSAM